MFLQAIAALTLAGVVPGLLLFELVAGRAVCPASALWERLVLSAAAGMALMVVGALALSYLPGPLEPATLRLAQLVLIGLLAAVMLITGRSRPNPRDRTGPADPSQALQPPDAQRVWLWAGLLALTFTAAMLRLPNLGYSEFQDDEVSVMLRAAEVIQGREDALFVHDKGPAEVLITATLYGLVNRTNEATARLPFAVANLVALAAFLLLGQRLLGPLAGWTAAMLLAVDGYFVGFSRMVQYQSIVFLMVVAALLAVHRLWDRRATTVRWLSLAALFLAVGALAHYEAIFGLIPAAVLLVEARRCTGKPALRDLLLPVALFGVLLAIFYGPFAAHPRFARTFSEITGNRIGDAFPYNNLWDWFFRSTIYSSVYAFGWMTVLALAAYGVAVWRHWPRLVALAAGAIAAAGLAVTLVEPAWLMLAGRDQTWFFFAVMLAVVCMAPRLPASQRAVWLWFSLPFVVSIFFVQKPRTHVYGFYFAWALLAGWAVQQGWSWLAARAPQRPLAAVGIATVTALTLLFGAYVYWFFPYTEQEVLRTWEVNRPRGYWTPYERPAQNAIFGFPFKNGWKAVGLLYADGVLRGPFARNGERGIAAWYTRGGPDCPGDAPYYIYTPVNEPTNRGLVAERPRPSEAEGYYLLATVQVRGETRLEVFGRTPPAGPPLLLDAEAQEHRFDAELSGPLFEQAGPVAEAQMTRSSAQLAEGYRFGDAIWLRGYKLSAQEVAPGDYLTLTLYWQATRPISTRYKVFTQVIDLADLHKAGQKDGAPGCDRYQTDSWLPGDLIADPYWIPIVPDARPGAYTLLIGLYDENGDRLPVFDGAGQPVGDAVQLTTITVLADP
ncbi:MAG TPA: glycosyltransferase family 39 protein [Caldilineaceae bacterium]|nr:glycosyltransferase family 39 protein [Caldilineaceae bacterium]